MKLFFICLVIICLSSCFLSDWDVRLSLSNTTNSTIRYWDEIKDKDDYIPDTAYCKINNLYSVLPNGKEIIRIQSRWEASLKDRPNKILRIYIINEDTLSKYGVCQVFLKQMFMKRFDLTYDDLEKMNWKIIYDGK